MTLTRISTGTCHAAGTTASAYTHTLVDAALAGDVLVVCGDSNGTHAAQGMSVSDSVNGVNFTTILDQDLSNASSRWLQAFIFRTPVDLAAGTTITFTPYALNTASTFSLDIFRGATATIDTGPLGQSPGTGTTSLTSALSPVPKAGSLVLSFGSFSSGTLTAGSPMTLGTTDGTGPSTAIGYVLGADGTTNYQNTWTGTVSTSNANVVVAYLPAASGGSSDGAATTAAHPGRGPSRFARFRQRAAGFIFATFPAATEALATGTASDANTAVAANASAASATGTAPDANANIAVNAASGAGVGTAYDATVVDFTASGGAFSTAMHPGRGPGRFARFYQRAAGFIFAIFPSATEALGTGTASDANIAIGASASAALGTGTANDANASIAVNAAAGAGVGTAYDATVVSATPNSGAFSTAKHPGRGPSLTRFFRNPNAGFSPAPVSGDVNAAAAAALGTGTAYDANISITANAANGVGTGTASDASASISGAAGAATGSTAQGSAAAVQANATAALGTGSAAATAAVAANAAAALAIGAAYDATIIAAANPAAGTPQNARHPGRGPSAARFIERPGGFSLTQTGAVEALAAGTAYNPTTAIVSNPAAASGTATANDGAGQLTVGAAASAATGTATGTFGTPSAAVLAALATGSAQGALAALRVNPAQAAGTGVASNVATGFNVLVDAIPALGTAVATLLWVARPKVASTGRPGSGTTARPTTGTTIDPG